MTTTCFVGWIIRVGAISGGCAVGGRNGVAVVAGEHAVSEKKIKITVYRIRLEKIRIFIIKEKGRPVAESPNGLSLFFFGCCTAAIIAATDIEWQSDLAAEGFLSNDGFNFTHQIRILAQVIFGVLTSLTNTNVAIREEGAALLDDLKLGRQVEYVTSLRNAFVEHNVKLGSAEGRSDLILDHF